MSPKPPPVWYSSSFVFHDLPCHFWKDLVIYFVEFPSVWVFHNKIEVIIKKITKRWCDLFKGYLILICITVIDIGHLVKVVSTRILHCKMTTFCSEIYKYCRGYWFISEWTHEYLFNSLGCNLILLLVYCSDQIKVFNF